MKESPMTTMSSTTAPSSASVDQHGAASSPPGALPTESSLLPRFVSLLTPFFAIITAWLAAWVARHTGAALDQTQVVSFMIAVVTAVLGTSWKWLQGWQQHEQRVADGADRPRRAGPPVGSP
jgi:hypothetical protein